VLQYCVISDCLLKQQIDNDAFYHATMLLLCYYYIMSCIGQHQPFSQSINHIRAPEVVLYWHNLEMHKTTTMTFGHRKTGDCPFIREVNGINGITEWH